MVLVNYIIIMISFSDINNKELTKGYF